MTYFYTQAKYQQAENIYCFNTLKQTKHSQIDFIYYFKDLKILKEEETRKNN